MSINISFVFTLKYPMAQLTLWILSWSKYILEIYWSCCVNWLTVLQLLIFAFIQKCRFSFLHIKRAHKSLEDLYVDPQVEWMKSKNHLLYPSNKPKYTNSLPYWVPNNLLLDFIFGMHNKLNVIIKISSTICLSCVVLLKITLDTDTDTNPCKSRFCDRRSSRKT